MHVGYLGRNIWLKKRLRAWHIKKKTINVKNFGGTPLVCIPSVPWTCPICPVICPVCPADVLPLEFESPHKSAQTSRVSLGSPEFFPGTLPGSSDHQMPLLDFSYRLFLHKSKKPSTRVSKRVPGVHGKRGLERGWQKRLAKGWRKVGEGLATGWRGVGEGLADFLAPSNFGIPEVPVNREPKVHTNFFCTKFLNTPRGPGHPGKILGTSQTPLFETPGRQTFEGGHELFGHHPCASRR